MPLIQTLFYFAGFIAFLLSGVILVILGLILLSLRKRVIKLTDKVEAKMDESIVSVIMPFLPAIIAFFSFFKKGKSK